MNALLAIPEAAFESEPRFFVEAPDGDRSRSELDRVVEFRRDMRMIAPRVKIWANANAGRRAPSQAIKEGIVAGVFDYACAWEPRRIAFPEFKGFDARGRAGELSRAQIDWGNAMLDLGFEVACFFRPASAIEWLRGLGAPFVDRRGRL